MSSVREKGNRSTELTIVKIFRGSKIAGWRRGYPGIMGRPDFVFPKKKIAVFVDGCFWHGFQKHRNIPVTNQSFWRRKIFKNKMRDQTVGRVLRSKGGYVIRIWKHQINNINKILIKKFIQKLFYVDQKNIN